MAPYLSKSQRVGVALALLCASEFKQRKERKKRVWINRYLKKRQTLGHSNLLNLRLDFDDIRNFLRMEKETFYELLEMVGPLITKKDTHMRQAVSADERLLVTLRYLATGRDYRELRSSSLISHQLISKIIPETCRAINKVLKKIMSLPSTEEEWKTAAQLFETQWQFNNCVGCMDGKHILIKKPPASGSLYYNHKGTFSVVLFAVVNANYEFIYVHTGSHGCMSYEEIIKNTSFHKKLNDNILNLPESYLLPETNISIPYVFLGDGALNTNIMMPFSEDNISSEEKIFNYRLHRAKRVVDNAFGILASRFRVLKQTIILNIDNINSVVLATCALHNFLIKRSKTYLTPKCVDSEDLEKFTLNKGIWRQETDQLMSLKRNFDMPSNHGKQIRNILTEYFNRKGRITFQDRMVNSVISQNT